MMDHDIRLGRIGSFIEIAVRKAQGRTTHPPARSPRLPVAPHYCGDRRRTAPADLTVTCLAKALYSRADQERAFSRNA
jgi:hypothetical protein